MKFSNFLKVEEILSKRILILGEVGSGKTFLTAKIVEFLCSHGFFKDITIIDMAPERKHGVGGRIRDFLSQRLAVRYLAPSRIYPPRTLGRNKREVLEYAYMNYMALKSLIDRFIKEPTRILVINDLTIYLHAGPLEDIVECFEKSETLIANAYYGFKLIQDYGSGVTEREKKLLESLFPYMDKVVLLFKKI
ncbi:MAG: hypothetical protein DRJ37_00225 [Thermoprotei archaeon]|nr:MAG: hypothetical protein DRJ37_00225 [Thermoprotei archaeon]